MKAASRIDGLRIASPCPAGWSQMTGDDRARFCELCNLHVYNISAMTRREAEALIERTEGRFCARLFRRADGTVITRDCPVGLRAIRRRVAKTAGAVFATIVSLCAIIVGQKPSAKDKSSCQRQVTLTKPDSPPESGVVSGNILDPYGAVVVGATLTLVGSDQGKATTATSTSDDQGCFRFTGVPVGTYELRIEDHDYSSLIITKISLAKSESINVAAVLMPKTTKTEWVGIVAETPLLDTNSTIKTVISGDMIRKLPIH